MGSEKPPVSQTQFGELDARQSTFEDEVRRRFDTQDKQGLKREAMIFRQGKQIESLTADMLVNTQSTRRTEAKIDAIAEKTKDFVEVADYARKTFGLVEWVVKRLLPLADTVGALIAGSGWLDKH